MDEPRISSNRPWPRAEWALPFPGWDVRAAGRWLLAWAVAHRFALGAAAVAFLALFVRAWHVLPAGFPLNDGGLFASMSRDIQRAGYALPEFTSYNALSGGDPIPFAYPPLALYLAALVEDLTPLSMVDVYWLLPALAASVAVAGVYALARTMFDRRSVALLAAAGFAVAPRSFEWLVMGGGAPRALSLATALFALAAYRRALDARPGEAYRRFLALATVLSAATLATHLETAVFLAAGMALCSVVRPSRRRALAVAVVGMGTPVLSAPWWGTVLARHGIEPFRAALVHGGDVLSDGEVTMAVIQRVIDPVFTAEPYFAVVGAAGALGAVIALARGRWLLPAWWALILVLQMRSFATYTVVPTAILAAYAAVEVVYPALRGGASRSLLARWRPVAVAAGVAGVAIFGAVEQERGEAVFLRPVSEADRAAMEWVAGATPEDALYLVIPERPWYADREGEWFPALTGRAAVNVPQGYEWVEDEFGRRAHLHHVARDCGSQGVDCLERLRTVETFTHVYLPAGCCGPLADALRADHGWAVRYDGAALVAERLLLRRAW